MRNDVEGLISFIEKSVSPYHAAAAASELLEKESFIPLDQVGVWNLEKGKNYYVRCFGTMLAAFHIGSEYERGDAFRIAASHVDWPCYYIKPNPEQAGGECIKLSVEPYGGMIHSTWLDRPLSAAGMAAVQGGNAMSPERRLVDFGVPIMTIPNLAIHMNRNVNKGVEINPNKDMLPLCKTMEEGLSKDGFFMDRLARLMDVEPERILSYDLCVYNAEKCSLVGFDNEFLSAPRLDNLTSTYALLQGIASCDRGRGITVAVLFDNEEVGSGTKQGADSVTLGFLLEKLIMSLGGLRSDYIDALCGGFMLSCDVAHAMHPNHAELADSSCHAYMNGGAAIKMNYEQRYATEASAVGMLEGLCKKYDIPYQRYMNRPDLRGGGTLGSYAAAQLGIPTVDIGVPMLAMHSARELMGVRDQESLNRIVSAYFCEE